MDTRLKILSSDSVRAALATGEWLAVAGLFDPVTVHQARHLANLRSAGRKLLAVVLDGADTLLPAQARAALLAGLREVDAVVIAQPERWRSLIPENSQVEILEDAGAERARSADFVQLVMRRQNAG